MLTCVCMTKGYDPLYSSAVGMPSILYLKTRTMQTALTGQGAAARHEHDGVSPHGSPTDPVRSRGVAERRVAVQRPFGFLELVDESDVGILSAQACMRSGLRSKTIVQVRQRGADSSRTLPVDPSLPGRPQGMPASNLVARVCGHVQAVAPARKRVAQGDILWSIQNAFVM